MSTITLSGNTLSGRLGVGSYYGLGSSFKSARTSTADLSKQLGTLRNKIDTVNTSASVDGSQAANAKTREENKSSALTCGYNKMDLLVSNVGTVDNKTATEVEKLKKDFYKKYDYLKPNDEKSWWDRLKDGAGKLWDKICDIGKKIAKLASDIVKWVGDHLELVLKAIAVVAMLVVSIALLCTGVGAILSAICWGCIIGIVFGGVTGGLDSLQNGGSFWEGMINGAFSGGIEGAISGAIFGGLGFLGQGVGEMLQFSNKTLQILKYTSKITGGISTLFNSFDLLALADKYIDPSFNPITDLNAKTHSSKVYNYTQTGLNVISTVTGGAYKGMNDKEIKAQNAWVNRTEEMDYKNLYNEHPRVQSKSGGDVTKTVKDTMVEWNKKWNDGVLRDDNTGERVLKSQKGNQKGVAPPLNEAQFDHKYPRSKGGKNGYENIQIISRENNLRKSDKVGFTDYRKTPLDKTDSNVTNSFNTINGVISNWLNFGR